MACEHRLIELDALVDLVIEDLVVRVLELVLFHLLDDLLLKLIVTNALARQAGEEILDKPLEERHIVEHELRHVHVTQRAHKQQVFCEVCVLSLERTSHDKYTLQRTKHEVVVILF